MKRSGNSCVEFAKMLHPNFNVWSAKSTYANSVETSIVVIFRRTKTSSKTSKLL